MSVVFRPLKAEEVECRVNQCTEKGCSLLLYKTSRVDMALLDETVGIENWQCDYKTVDGMLFCGIGIRVGDDWVWKWDTGTPSNMEEVKGHASDAFKRAGFKVGIGRELYSSPRIWISAEHCNIKQGRNGKPQCYDDFRVTEMVVDDGQIVLLTISNMSRRGIVVYGNGKGKKAKPPTDDLKAAKDALWRQIQAYAQRHGMSPDDVLEGVKKRPEWEAMQGSADWFRGVAREFEEADG